MKLSEMMGHGRRHILLAFWFRMLIQTS